MSYINIDMQNVQRCIKFPFPVCGVGYYSDAKPNKLCKKYDKRIEFCLRLFAKNDSAVDIIDGKKYMTRYPHLIIKAPESEHIYEINDSRESFFFMYSKELLPELEKTGLILSPYIVEIKPTPQMINLINRIKVFFSKTHDFGVADEIDILCFQLLEQFTLAASGAMEIEDHNTKKIRAIASYMQLHFRDDIVINKLIGKNNFSRRAFFRSWNDVYNITPLQHLTNLRLNEGKRLLEETDLPVADIAESIGINYSSYFVSQFKKKYGITPLQFRKNSQRHKS